MLTKCHNALLLTAAAAALIGCAASAGPTRDTYDQYLPEMPKVLQPRDPADTAFGLYGECPPAAGTDSRYHDGIADSVADYLLLLAEKFSPVMRRENESVPRDFCELIDVFHERYNAQHEELLECELIYDEWGQPQFGQRRIDSLCCPLFLQGLGSRAPHLTGLWPPSTHGDPTSRLRTWLPTIQNGQVMDPLSGDERKWLYFNWPGHDPVSWRKFFLGRHPNRLGHSVVYAHPFIHTTAPDSDEKFEFVIQYWFFYPFNNGGNDHEGDWEHINVRITTAGNSNPEGRLTADEVKWITQPSGDASTDSAKIAQFVIAKVDYYFHHKVVTLTYPRSDSAHSLPGAGMQRWMTASKPESLVFEAAPAHRARRYEFNTLANRTRMRLEPVEQTVRIPADTLRYVSTHPVCYIAGQNKGLDVLLHGPSLFHKSVGFDSHGTYPFPGVWKDIGTMGAAEAIGKDEDETYSPPELGTQYRQNAQYVTYTKDHIVLVPDWEHVLDGMRSDSVLLQRWAWLVLPIRWGFPVTYSTGSSLLKRIDLGNYSPVGPAYNFGWNTVGVGFGGYEAYEPYYISNAVLLTPFDSFHNRLGWLNPVTIPVVGSPVVAAYRWIGVKQSKRKVVDLGALVQEMNRGSLHELDGFRKYTHRNDSQLSFGYHWLTIDAAETFTFGNDKAARLLPHPGDSRYQALFEPYAGSTRADAHYVHDNAWSPNRDLGFPQNIRISIRHGATIETENSYFHTNSEVGYDLVGADGSKLAHVRGLLHTWDIRGSLRANLWRAFRSRLKVFGRAGFGVTFSKLTDAEIRDAVSSQTTKLFSHSEFFHSTPNLTLILPNVWFAGVGFQFAFCRFMGINAEYDRSVQRSLASERILNGRGKTSYARGQLQMGLYFAWWL